jgi:hypothetical protein
MMLDKYIEYTLVGVLSVTWISFLANIVMGSAIFMKSGDSRCFMHFACCMILQMLSTALWKAWTKFAKHTRFWQVLTILAAGPVEMKCDECPICLQCTCDWMLPCGHTYHKKCLRLHVIRTRRSGVVKCAVCRDEIYRDEQHFLKLFT